MRLEIQCEDRIGMVREALDLFIPHQIDMRLVEVDTKRRCIYCGFSDIPFAKLQRLLADIRRLDSVEDVKIVMFTPSEREHNALYTLLEALPDGVISVDLKGHITMVTELAAEDLQVPIAQLLHKPLQHFIKGMYFSKETWANPKEGTSKRIRIRNKTLLLEMKPIFVCDDDGMANPAGTVIYVKSKARLDRQADSLKQAPDAENRLESYFLPVVTKSEAMRRTLRQAKAFADVPQPLFVQGEMGTGKRDLINALFQYWHKGQADSEAQLVICPARDMTRDHLPTLEKSSGWFVIEDVEYLNDEVQIALANWLARQPSESTSFGARMRVVCLSSLTPVQLADGTRIQKSLYFSLATLVLSVPSLRERKDDLEGLVQHIVAALSERYRQPVPTISKSAFVKLALYAWPGNLKELQNTCLQTFLTVKDREWQVDDICLPECHDLINRTLIADSLEVTVKQWEADLLKQLYPRFPSTRRLAKAVGMSHSAIANKLKEYGIST
ncbi:MULTISPECIES: TyrR/PhhR family helix-turn-helix DNA-binding protein [Marinomonas]|uniref:Sigma 54-interacting transcriptional regulator n=1 Tax=Marinomonas arctica TaxID=383750 RepID=A0A7H1J270_9GAMM|nr:MULTISPECIES: TyrR/PhhR family helix-turn-helix DNA-binding protein [Marinomonas]MCS7488312.1 transcriptional regulator [Marinomonas sp. BSi20414]QNT04586.1 sigma 54-interacting transcriptional regulator [Marinomonas arctica]GGN32910.1 TyrR family transcriptional regulator [Marinomonas arctica]